MDAENGLAYLAKFVEQPDAIIFVGSGISAWSGLPSWTELIEKLADHLDAIGEQSDLIRRELVAGDLLQAASFGFDKLTSNEIGAFIRSQVSPASTKPHDIHRLIVTLGPTCFVTTNYDNLLEQALSLWRSDQFFRAPIVNLQLTDIADIISARSTHFVFKPHGDAANTESIILTREQYRALMPDGALHGALDALKTLLATRPVLYLGFGLRDPDFIYIRDLLLNTYRGGLRPHCAIIADLSETEIDFWRRKYGLRVVTYSTSSKEDARNPHEPLRLMLDNLVTVTGKSLGGKLPTARKPSEAERVLALTRFTAGVMRLAERVSNITTRVSQYMASGTRSGFAIADFSQYQGWEAQEFLVTGPSKALLLGLPGAGKSHNLRLAAAGMAEKVHEACVADSLGDSNPVLPIYVDLKLFQGNLSDQITSILPPGFDLKTLAGGLQVRLFLDAFNEMPSTYLDDGSFVNSLNELIGNLPTMTMVIASRTPDAMPVKGMELYELSHFDRAYVERALLSKGITIAEYSRDDMLALLSRPFFLRLVTKDKVKLPDEARLIDVYRSYFAEIKRRFDEHFAGNLDVMRILSLVAYRSLEEDREAFPISWILECSRAVKSFENDLYLELVNWLLSQDVCIAYTGNRISFIHQSITEYLASMHLARLLAADAVQLIDIIRLKKWDQCLFLTLAMLPPQRVEDVFDELKGDDLQLALNAARFAEVGQGEIIDRLLISLLEDNRLNSWDLAFPVSRLPFSKKHVAKLTVLANRAGSIGGAAAMSIARIEGVDCKPLMKKLLEDRISDFNYCHGGLIEAWQLLVSSDDVGHLLALGSNTGTVDPEANELNVLAEILRPLDISVVGASIVSKSDPNLAAELFPRYLAGKKETEALTRLLHLVENGNSVAVEALYEWMDYGRDASSHELSAITSEQLQCIWAARTRSSFVIELLAALSKFDKVRDHFSQMLPYAVGVDRVAQLLFLGRGPSEIFDALSIDLRERPAVLRDLWNVHVYLNELDWTGREELFVALYELDNDVLRHSLSGPSSPVHISGLAEFSRGQVLRLIQVARKDLRDRDWPLVQLGSIVGRFASEECREYLLSLLADADEPVRRFVKNCVLTSLAGLSIDDLPSDAVALLLADLNSPRGWWGSSPLALLITEKFVEEHLLPLANEGSDVVANNVRELLAQVSHRFGRRFILGR